MRDVARQWAEVYVAKLRGATHNRQRGIKPKRPLKAAVEEYLRHRKGTVEYNTHASDVTALEHLLDLFGGTKDVQAIDPEAVQGWFNARADKYRLTTLETYAIHMRKFFDFAGHPIGRIILRKRHRHDPYALSDDGIKAVFGACKTDRERLVIRTALATGARKAELWALEWEDFRPDMRSVRIQRQIAWPLTTTKGLKGKRNRTALVLPGFMDGYERGSGRVMPGWVMNDKTAADVVRRVLKRAGLWVPGRSSHVLRHTYSRLGLEKYGWSLEMLKRFLGHQSIKTTEIYEHFGEEVAIRLAEERTYGKA